MVSDSLKQFIHDIPKTDLHLHLDGSLRIPTLIELAKQALIDLPADTEEGLRKLVFKDQYTNLPEYLTGFGLTCSVMKSAENIERIAYEVACDNIGENVRYIEVRFAPQLHISADLGFEEILRAVHHGLQRAAQDHNLSKSVQDQCDLPFHFGIIVCAMRCFFPQMSPYYEALFDVMAHAQKGEVFAAASLELVRAAVELRDKEGLNIVGFDLAGEEAGYPAIEHKAAFQYAHSHFLKKTIHAGEAYGPESIFQAITDCYANRIGHGTFLYDHDMVQDQTVDDPQAFSKMLSEYIASQRITFEVCPTSNLQTIPEINDLSNHPLRKMLDQELSVSICTDNRLVSNTTVSQELLNVLDAIPVKRHELRNLVLAGFKGSFFPGSYVEKRSFVRHVIHRYDSMAAKVSEQDLPSS